MLLIQCHCLEIKWNLRLDTFKPIGVGVHRSAVTIGKGGQTYGPHHTCKFQKGRNRCFMLHLYE